MTELLAAGSHLRFVHLFRVNLQLIPAHSAAARWLTEV
jgi:hypothetical protein